MNAILHRHLPSYMYNTDINIVQCFHVVLEEPDAVASNAFAMNTRVFIEITEISAN